jgi:hypothetical protein
MESVGCELESIFQYSWVARPWSKRRLLPLVASSRLGQEKRYRAKSHLRLSNIEQIFPIRRQFCHFRHFYQQIFQDLYCFIVVAILSWLIWKWQIHSQEVITSLRREIQNQADSEQFIRQFTAFRRNMMGERRDDFTMKTRRLHCFDRLIRRTGACQCRFRRGISIFRPNRFKVMQMPNRFSEIVQLSFTAAVRDLRIWEFCVCGVSVGRGREAPE